MVLTTADIRPSSPDGIPIQFDNSQNQKFQSDPATLGFSNTWTMQIWMSAFDIDMGTIQYILEMKPSSGDANRISMFINNTTGQIEVSTFDSSGSGLKTYRWPNALRTSTSAVPAGSEHVHLALRWDGTTLDLFRNGTNMLEAGTLVKDLDNSGTMSDSPSRAVSIGNSIAGGQGIDTRLYTITIWDKALEDAEIETLANHGFYSLDVRVNQGSYISVANLVHWFRMGQPVGSIGVGGALNIVTDEVASGGINLEAAAVGITEVDITDSAVTRGFGQSIDFGGSEFLDNLTPQAIGLANEWTISIWYRSDDAVGSGTLRGLLTIDGAGNTIELSKSSLNKPTIILKDGSGTIFRQIVGNTTDFFAESVFVHCVVTWDGTAGATGGITFYKNGILTNAQTVTTSIAGSQSDSNRTVEIARKADGVTSNGDIGHVAVWNTVLAADEIRQVAVNRWSMDLREDTEGYGSAANLKHW